MSRVTNIFACEDKGQPMLEFNSVYTITGKGIRGDRYAEERGAYSVSMVPKIRHISLVALEAIMAANQELETPFALHETRRNLVTEDTDLNNLIGRDFHIGGVALRGVELCDPCRRPEKLAGKSGFSAAFQARGGIRAEVLTSGFITIHDEIITSKIS